MARCRLSLLLGTVVAASLAQAPLARAGEAPQADPAAAEVAADLTFLADDLLAGRDSGTPGYDIAARFVAARFASLGLTPAGADGGWFQPVTLREARLAAPAAITLTWRDATGAHSAALDQNRALTNGSLASPNVALDAPLVFAGYAIDRPDLGFDDYRGLDVKGKVVVVLSGAPKGTNSETGAFLASEKTVMAMKHGAVALVSLPTSGDLVRVPWPRRIEGAARPTRSWVGADGVAFRRAPAIIATVTLHPDAAAPLFAAAHHPLPAILAAADKPGGKPHGFALGASLQLALTSTWRDIATENVVALLPGSDPALARESVVLSAHLDHLGSGGKGADAIYNGAMDNAAGVSTMLAAARLATSAGKAPRRSLLFVALTGEESGLLGSDYLARHPLPAAGTMVADVNFDMPILLYHFTDVVAFGADHSTIGPIAAAAARSAGVTLSPDPLPEEGLFTRSDHYRFVQQGIPAVFMMTGFAGEGEKQFRAFLKDHYHQVSDDLKLPFLWDAGALFARVNGGIVTALANADEAPRWFDGDLFGREFAPAAPKAPRPVAAQVSAPSAPAP